MNRCRATILSIAIAAAALMAGGCASLGIGHQAAADVNYRSIADVTRVDIPELTIDLTREAAALFDDMLKGSNAQSVHIGHLVIRTGGGQREQAVDLNRLCKRWTIDVAEIQEGAQNAWTTKGGCSDIYVGELVIDGPFNGNCDIELGGLSDQSPAPVTGVHFGSVRRTDGRPVRLRVGNADYPQIDHGAIDYQAAQSLLLKLYVQLFGPAAVPSTL